MADTKEKAAKPAQPVAAGDPGGAPRVKEKKEKKARKPADGQQAPAAEPEGPPPEPAPRPRLLDYYEQRVRSKLAQQFGLGNPHQIPRLRKIVLNVGMGDAIKNPKGLEAAVAELAAISGQRPVVTKAKKSIANFNLRKGLPADCPLTLTGPRIYPFPDRLIPIAPPRIH